MTADEPMPDEQLAADADGRELVAVARAHHNAYMQSHSHAGAFACCSAHTSADDVPELLDEIKRLRAVETKLRATIADEHTRLSQDLDNAEEVQRLRSDNGALIESGRKWMKAANADHDRAVAVEAELAEVRACYEQAHADNGKLHAFIEELTTVPIQWCLVAPDGARQVFPREAVEGGAPWPEGWRIETRNVSYSEWKAADDGRSSHCPWCGAPVQLGTDGLVPLHEHPTYCDECPGTGRRPSEAPDGQ